jgi:hypothetical protein
MMEVGSYKGWENKFTWLVHLHLSNEYPLMNEITALVVGEPNDGAAGRLVEMWVKVALTEWLTCFPGRNRQHDGEMRLLAWDLLGSALAYTSWDDLVALLIGAAHISNNLFTMTLYRNILHHHQLQQQMSALLSTTASMYVAADALKQWFEQQVEIWIASLAARCQHYTPMTLLAQGLIQNTYGVIAWEHAARAFRPGY